MMNRTGYRILKVVLPTLAIVGGLFTIRTGADSAAAPLSRVLLLSIDGLHASDLAWYVAHSPNSTLAMLSASGRTYTHASATKPSDSFPGMLAMVTGGTPRSTGVYYDDGWDRSLAAAGTSITCVGGTRVRWKQNLDVAYPTFATFPDFKAFWTGPSLPSPWPLDPTKLPRDPAQGCAKEYPHMFPRVNNVFELIKAAGGRTAWSDKHPAYEFLMGRSGTGIDDLYAPEIATPIGSAPSLLSPLTAVITDNFQLTMNYDDLKVDAIVNEVNGLDHKGTTAVGVPSLFGMNFQAVSVGQKLDMTSLTNGKRGGYDPISGAPSQPLVDALDHTDSSIGRMMTALQTQGLLDSTLIIISAKHGNSPINPNSLVRIDPAVINTTVNSVAAGLAAQVSADTGPLIWLKDQSKTAAVVAALDANRAGVRIAGGPGEGILSGAAVAALFADPLTDSRAPDIILMPIQGTVYVAPVMIGGLPMWSKIADHGSFYDDDVHVGLLVSNPHFAAEIVDQPVETRQIACTILNALAIDCSLLQSQAIEPSTSLPHDTTPPTLTLPADIITDATSPSGAVVSYSATAVDAVDGPVAVTCAPASGSIFAITTTTVNCSASDHVGNTQTGSFSVLVLSPAEIVSDLVTAADNFQQARNLLQKAMDKISSGNIVAACGKLGAFINQVQAQSGKSLMPTDAASLIGSASDARAALACQ